jgi:hypothetical protein
LGFIFLFLLSLSNTKRDKEERRNHKTKSARSATNKTMEGLKLHSVSFAEFDIDVGNTLAHKYPQFKIDEYDDEYLANCCLPDGGHIHAEDRTFLVLQVKLSVLASSVAPSVVPKKGKGSSSSSSSSSSSKKEKKPKKSARKDKDKDSDDEDDDDADGTLSAGPITTSQSHASFTHASGEGGEDRTVTLYGVGYFRNRPDKTVKRGALQKAILILTWQPFFEMYYAPALATLERYLDDNKNGGKNGKNLLKTLYESIQNLRLQGNLQLQLYDQVYPLNVPKVEEDEFEGASLVDLVKIFQVLCPLSFSIFFFSLPLSMSSY